MFTYYTLFGNAMQPSQMKCQQFIAMCKRCGLLTGTGVTEADCDVRLLLHIFTHTRLRASALQRPRLEPTARAPYRAPRHSMLRLTGADSACFQTHSPNSLARSLPLAPKHVHTFTHQQHRWSFKPKLLPPSASPRPAKCSSPTSSTASPASLGASCRRPSPRRHSSR